MLVTSWGVSGWAGFEAFLGDPPGTHVCVQNEHGLLQAIRNQVALYEHRNGHPPRLGLYWNENGWGDAEEGGLIGNDYLRYAPMNDRTETSSVVLGVPNMEPARRGDVGWYWDGERIWLNGFDELEGCWIEAVGPKGGS